MTVRIYRGDCRDVLRTLPDESVHCVVTSPPYFGLRDYGVDGQIGQEANPDEFVAEMVAVFREVRRVLRDDGTLWLNLGDTYSASGNGVGSGKQLTNVGSHIPARRTEGLAPKQLIGIPWRVAFALQADGWWLRQDIIWSKPNPMPESVTDRCTKAHEYLFLLSKSKRYYFDALAIAECAKGLTEHDLVGTGYSAPGQTPHTGTRRSDNKDRKPASARGVPIDTGGSTNGVVAGSVPWGGTTRNKRSVWTVGTVPFHDAHFSTFPPALIKPAILAGCAKGGNVLDPFGGAGTTGLVADRLDRDAILIELNPEYADMAARRLRKDGGMFIRVEVVNHGSTEVQAMR